MGVVFLQWFEIKKTLLKPKNGFHLHPLVAEIFHHSQISTNYLGGHIVPLERKGKMVDVKIYLSYFG